MRNLGIKSFVCLVIFFLAEIAFPQVLYWQSKSTPCSAVTRKTKGDGISRADYRADPLKNVVIRIDAFSGKEDRPSSVVLNTCTVIDKSNWRCEGILGVRAISPDRDGAQYAIDGVAYYDPLFEFGASYHREYGKKYHCVFREVLPGVLKLLREFMNY